jgi:2-succinyl-6-hydroxy-2,4-cyclohexadiene-1-carboxylate synthase
LLENNHPWNAAVIISAHPGLETETERASRRERDAAWASRSLTDSWSSFLDDWCAQPVLQGAEIRDAQRDSRLALRRREIARSFMDWSLGAQEPLWDRLSEIKIPVLWIAGGNDKIYTEIAHRAAGFMPDARVAIAPDCGHRVPWQAESWLVDQVAGFLA